MKIFKSTIALLIVFTSSLAMAENKPKVTINTSEKCYEFSHLQERWDKTYSKKIEQNYFGFDENSPNYIVAHTMCLLENTGVANWFNFLEYVMKAPSIRVVPNKITGQFAWTNPTTGVIEIQAGFFNEKNIDVEYKRAAVLVHEARHSELIGKKIPNEHVVCEKGELRGSASCDPELIPNWDIASPYAWELMFINGVYMKSVNSFDRESLKGWNDYALANHFNHIDPTILAKFSRSNESNNLATIR